MLHATCYMIFMIKSEIKNLPKSEIEISVSLPWKYWEKFVKEAVADLSKEIKISGFRGGKAPRDLVEQKVGKGALLEEAANKAIRSSYEQIIKEKELDVIGNPKAELVKIEENSDLEYKITTAVVPKAQLKSWKDKIKKINSAYKEKKVQVSEEDIKKELEYIANSRVQLVDVEREAKDGDSVLLDFQVKRDGVLIENGSSKNHPLILGRGVFIPGFEEKIVGMKTNEEKEFELKFPHEYHEKSLAGKDATFSVKLNKVQERKTPEITDEFAKSLGKFENLDALKKSITEGMTEEKTKELAEKKRGEMIDKLVESAEVDLPEILIHEELHKMLGEFEMQLQGMGMDLNTYFQQIKKTQEEIEKEWHPQAEKRVKAALAMEAVAKEENIEVSSEEIEEEMNKTLEYYKNIKDVEKNIDLGRLYNYVKGVKQNEKVFEMLEKIS